MQDKNKNKIQEMIRVNHAGEFGAQKIYNAQIKYSKNERLKKKLKKDAQGYDAFWAQFGRVIKEGLYEDFENREFGRNSFISDP